MSKTDKPKPGPKPKSSAKKRPKRPSPNVREMTVEDLPGVFELGETLFRTAKWRALRWTWDEYVPVGLFATDGEFCLVAELNGQMVGFVLGSLLEKRKSAWTYGYVEWLGVSPEYARSGIAQSLVSKVTERFLDAGARMLLVDTDAENADAIAFFEKLGFGHSAMHVYMSLNLEKD